MSEAISVRRPDKARASRALIEIDNLHGNKNSSFHIALYYIQYYKENMAHFVNWKYPLYILLYGRAEGRLICVCLNMATMHWELNVPRSRNWLIEAEWRIYASVI